MSENMTSKTLFQNSLILRRAGVANFADISKIAVILVKETCKDSNKVKIIRKMYQNVTRYCALYAPSASCLACFMCKYHLFCSCFPMLHLTFSYSFPTRKL